MTLPRPILIRALYFIRSTCLLLARYMSGRASRFLRVPSLQQLWHRRSACLQTSNPILLVLLPPVPLPTTL